MQGSFKHLTALVLGSSVGGQWVYKSVLDQLIRGMCHLARLQHFSMKHTCTSAVLAVLAANGCASSLVYLDVESSPHVDDTSMDSLTRLEAVEILNLFNTKLSDDSLAEILLSMPRLTRLVRGDFLCDALAWIDDSEECPIMLIQGTIHECSQLHIISSDPLSKPNQAFLKTFVYHAVKNLTPARQIWQN